MKPIAKIKQLRKSQNRYKIAYGGRGSGKSYGIADILALKALDEPGVRILCTRDIQNTLSESALAILKRVIEARGISSYFLPTRHGLACKNGTEFIFRGLQNPDRIKSLEGIKYCWIEEAQRVSQEAWDMLIPTIRLEDSEFWINFNPDQEDDPVYTHFVKPDRPDTEVVKINWQDNPYFPEVLRGELEWDKKHNFDKYLWVWEGECRTVSERQVFKGKYRVDYFDTPKDEVFYYGADWGFSNDPTVLIRCFIRNKICWIDSEAYAVGVDIDELPRLFNGVPGADIWPVNADSARPETISYLRQNGFPKMRGAHKGQGSVEDGIEFIKSFDGVMIHPRCKHTIDEFKLYSYKEDKLTGEPTPILEDKNNHCIDALRYALEKVMQRHGSMGTIGPDDLGL